MLYFWKKFVIRARFVKKSLRLFLLFFLMASGCFAVTSIDYYVKDSVAYYGISLVDYGLKRNCQTCVEVVRDVQKSYSPKEVSEYGIGASLSYVAKDIFLNKVWKRVFLERKIVGSFSLYHYQDSRNDLFFLQREGEYMVELLKENELGHSFRQQLAEFTNDNPIVSATSVNIEYNQKSIMSFLVRYNGVQQRRLPKMKMGIGLGINLTKLEPLIPYFDPDFDIFQFRYNTGASLSAFLDIPFSFVGASLQVGCLLTNAAFSYSKIFNATDYDFVANLHSLELPIHVRFSYPIGVLKPYVFGGVLLAWNFHNSNVVQKSYLEGSVVEFQGLQSMDLIDNHYWGPSFGCGVEFPVKGLQAVFMEFRYARCIGWSNPKDFALSKLNLTTGIVF